MAKTKAKKRSRVELGAESIIEDIIYMLDPDPLKIEQVRVKLEDILDHAQMMGIFYEFRKPGDNLDAEGRNGYATAFNNFEKSISGFSHWMQHSRSYSLVNGKNPMDTVIKIIRTCSKFLSAISQD